MRSRNLAEWSSVSHREGVVVMAIEPRPTPRGTENLKSPYLGLFNLLSLRAFLVGRTIVGLRIDDVLRAMDWLTSRSTSRQ